MKQYPKYEVESSDELDIIEFTSVGKKGNIAKAILFEPTENTHIYNLAFGDIIVSSRNKKRVEIDDEINTDNGDRDKVLATVASAVFDFTNRFPERWITFAGSDKIRTRLYRMAITKNYAELSLDFSIFGLQIVNNDLAILPFESNANYIGFITKRKI